MAELPGSEFFKVMVVKDEWKYIFMANGGREQLFNLQADPDEICIAPPKSRMFEQILMLWR